MNSSKIFRILFKYSEYKKKYSQKSRIHENTKISTGNFLSSRILKSIPINFKSFVCESTCIVIITQVDETNRKVYINNQVNNRFKKLRTSRINPIFTLYVFRILKKDSSRNTFLTIRILESKPSKKIFFNAYRINKTTTISCELCVIFC